MRRHHHLVRWLILAALAAWIGPSVATVSPHPCPADGVGRCYTITVIDGHGAATATPTARFEVLVAPRRQPNASGSPIFVVEGLGEAGTAAAHQGLIGSLEPLNRTHDLVFVDQRGVSGALVLRCLPRLRSASLAASARSYYDPTAIRTCRDRWANRLDLRHLDSHHFAQDIEATRRSLGYGRVAIVGYFYGSRIVEEYLRRFGTHVSAALLIDVAVPGVSMSRTQARAQARALARVEGACVADRACRARFPGFADDIATVNASLSRGPLVTNIAHDGISERVVVPAGEVRDWLSGKALRIGTAGDVPPAIHALARGDNATIAAAILNGRRVTVESLPFAEILAVRCNEDRRDTSRAALEQERACDHWPRGDHVAAGALRTNVPVLGVTAEDGLIAPLEAVRHLFARLPNARLVVFPGRARAADYDWDACLRPMAIAFLSGTRLDRIDASCAQRLSGSAFVVAANGFRGRAE